MAPLLLLVVVVLLPLSSSSATPHHHHHRPHTPLPMGITIPPPQIHQACAATRFPDLCESTLSHSPSLPDNPSASDLILSSMSSSAAAIPAALSHAASILASSASNPNRTNAARNCLDLLSYSSHRLSKASLSLPSSLPDSRAWTTAALIYQYDCFSAYKYVNGTKQVDDAMRYLLSLTSLTSNVLSLLFSFHRFGKDTSLWRPPQTERDGYWDSSSSPSPSSPVSIPSDLTPDATVCKDQGYYCYKTVQEAVDAAPCFGSKRFVIQIKAGVYEEIVRVPFNKTNLVFLGDGIGKTVITGSLNAQMPGVSTYNTATVAVNGDGFMARDLTFENTAGPDSHQAVAFRSDSDLSVFENVEFLGHQDTLYCHSLRQYYRSCRIEGTVDFVFGNSATVFQNCTILVRPRQLEPEKGETNAVSAQGRTDPAQSTGFVFDNCTVDGTEEYLALYKAKPAAHKNYLGRPWKEYSRTVYLNCKLGEIVRPEGWLPWTGDFALATLFYGELGSYGPGGNVSARVSWSNQIPAEHIGVYSVENFIQGDGWVPT